MAQPTAGVGEAAADWHLIETKSFNRLSEELSLPSIDFVEKRHRASDPPLGWPSVLRYRMWR